MTPLTKIEWEILGYENDATYWANPYCSRTGPVPGLEDLAIEDAPTRVRAVTGDDLRDAIKRQGIVAAYNRYSGREAIRSRMR